MLWGRIAGEAEPHVVACAIGREVLVAVSDAALLGILVPAAAPDHPVLADLVETPFPDVSAHVEDPQLIGLPDCHLPRATAAVVVIPRHRADVIAATVFVALGVVPAPGGELPFFLAWQAVAIGRGVDGRHRVAGPIDLRADFVDRSQSGPLAGCIAPLDRLIPSHRGDRTLPSGAGFHRAEVVAVRRRP